jgi:hypothetical protein
LPDVKKVGAVPGVAEKIFEWLLVGTVAEAWQWS